MVVGRAPFAEGTMVQKLLQHQQEMPPEISDLRAVPTAASVIVHRLMSKCPQDRFSIQLLEYELLSIAEEEGFDVTVSRPAVDIESTGAGSNTVLWPWAVVGRLIGFVYWTAMAAPKNPAKSFQTYSTRNNKYSKIQQCSCCSEACAAR